MEMREPLASLRRAERAIERERRRCEGEREAFEQFREQVARHASGAGHGRGARPAGVPGDGVQGTHAGGPATLRTPAETRSDVEWVRETYRETVMTADPVVELGESPRQHATHELGADVASAMFDAGGSAGLALGPVQVASRQAVSHRRRVTEWLDAEAADVAEARTTLADATGEIAAVEERIETGPPDDLFADYDRIPGVVARCESVVADRQETLHGTRFPDTDAVSIGVEHLYADCEFTYPVLTAVAATVDWAEDCRERIEQRVADLE